MKFTDGRVPSGYILFLPSSEHPPFHFHSGGQVVTCADCLKNGVLIKEGGCEIALRLPNGRTIYVRNLLGNPIVETYGRRKVKLMFELLERFNLTKSSNQQAIFTAARGPLQIPLALDLIRDVGCWLKQLHPDRSTEALFAAVWQCIAGASAMIDDEIVKPEVIANAWTMLGQPMPMRKYDERRFCGMMQGADVMLEFGGKELLRKLLECE